MAEDTRLYRLRNQATLYLHTVGIDSDDDRAVLEHLRATDMFPSLREELEAAEKRSTDANR